MSPRIPRGDKVTITSPGLDLVNELVVKAILDVGDSHLREVRLDPNRRPSKIQMREIQEMLLVRIRQIATETRHPADIVHAMMVARLHATEIEFLHQRVSLLDLIEGRFGQPRPAWVTT